MIDTLNVDIEFDLNDFKSLNYQKDYNLTQELENYIEAGHNKENIMINNYSEPNPMPAVVEKIKNFFPLLKNISVAVNLFHPGQYIPLHSDLYEKYIKLHNIQNIDNICRIIIMLHDGYPGQILQIQNNFYSDWKQGDSFIWYGGTSHAFYNLGKHDRYAIQLTGYKK